MNKEQTKIKKQADRDLEHFLDGQKAAMEMIHEELFDELVQVQEAITKALSILGDMKNFTDRKNRQWALRGDNPLES